MRCFIGAFVDANDRSKVASCISGLAGVRTVNPDKYHVTVSFLGEISSEIIPIHLRKVEEWRSAFPVDCRGYRVTGFPKAHCARVVVLRVDSGGVIESLVPDEPTVRPHITLGYARRRSIVVSDIECNTKLTLQELHLIKSEKGVYTPLEHV